jgi:hypothetical protein
MFTLNINYKHLFSEMDNLKIPVSLSRLKVAQKFKRFNAVKKYISNGHIANESVF